MTVLSMLWGQKVSIECKERGQIKKKKEREFDGLRQIHKEKLYWKTRAG